jgi:hypothetical protein
MTDANDVPICTCFDDWHANNAGNHALTCPVIAAFATLTRERDEAVKRRREIDDEAFDYAEQIETLKTQLAAARELMAEAATDIGYMVNAEYHGPNDVHPAMRAKYTRDMEIVTRIDAALTQEDTP